ncbi:MAG: relaxase domain-containing protein [Actinomycetota bacterium]|nr:relaxase domain-containing protein [Actinomycetota bacterium]
MLNVATCHDPEYPLAEVTHDATDYYLRQGEAPGRWAGAGAATLGLAGEVDPQALRDLFAGKDPATGRYLTSARGSSARAAARHGEVLLDVPAVAALLGASTARVRSFLRSGKLVGDKTAKGHWRVSAASIDALLKDGSAAAPAEPITTPGEDATYSLSDAARVAGVDRSYLQRLVRTEAPEVTTREDGTAVQYLVGKKDDRGRWRVEVGELARFMAARQVASAVPAYDLAMRAPKSVSVLHALGHLVPPKTLISMGLPTNVTAEVAAAHRAAVDDAISLLERHAAWIRGPGGRVQATGFTVALFDHRSSRCGDPLLHSHAVIANVATGVDGRRAALDGTALYAWAAAAGHVYQARLRAELVLRLGVRFHQPHNGLADLVGVPRQVIDAFSERRRQILRAMADLGATGARGAQVATLATRPAKDADSHQSPDQLAARATALGFGADQLAAVVGHGRDMAVSPRRLSEVVEHLSSPEGLTARAARVDIRDAIKGFATEFDQGASAAELESWAVRLLHDPRRFVPVLAPATRTSDVIRRADGRLVSAAGVERTWSTPELLAQETRLVAAHAQGQEKVAGALGVARPDSLSAALAARPTLSGEQAAMVRSITTSGVGIEVVVGGPGTGKTFALGAAAEAWRSSGYRVIGAALQGGAAEVLAREAALDAHYTLTALLLRLDHAGAGILADSVVVVDEAGMADTRQLSRLAAYAGAAEAKLVLVGDPDQIPEVGAGGAFGHLVERLGAQVVVLSENRRQRHTADRERLELIRQGRGAEVIASAKADGRWRVAPSADELRQRLVRDWHADPTQGPSAKLMVATTVAEVEWLNRAARAVLLAEGRLGERALTVALAASDRAVETRELRVGDWVRATRNDWAKGVFTGQVGTVVAVDPGHLCATVAFDAGRGPARALTLGPEFLCERAMRGPTGRIQLAAPGLTHAYAATANAVQGRTATRAYVLVSEAGLHRQGAYVAASRAAYETYYYGLTVPDPDEVDRLDRGRGTPAPDPEDFRALAQAMARDASQTMASVADPVAAAAGELMAQPTSWLWAEHAAVSTRLGALRPPLAESLRQVRNRLADAYGLSLEAVECRQLSAAVSRALAVPGATPERLVELMVHRGGTDEVSELASAKDRMAVLVWAAGTHATQALRRDHDAGQSGRIQKDQAAIAADAERLAVLDQALARQREARLALAESDPSGPLAGLLGPPPRLPAGLRAWRRAAAAVLDYRDAAGLHDRDGGESDPLTRAFGAEPRDAALHDHYLQARAVLHDCRVATVLAELPALVPALPHRPPPAVAAMAERPLSSLDADLSRLRQAADRHTRLVRRAEAAARAVDAAREEVAEARQRSAPVPEPVRRSRWPRRHPDPTQQPSPPMQAAVERAESDLARAEAHAEAATAELDSAPVAEPARIQELIGAIRVREERLRAGVLRQPPGWLRADVAERVADPKTDAHLRPERLADAYGAVAVFADRAGRRAEASSVQEIVGAEPADPQLWGAWKALHEALGPEPPGAAPEAGVDLVV